MAAEGNRLSLLEATHSLNGDVRANLVSTDRLYAILAQGEALRLIFQAEEQSSDLRFSLMSRGHYVLGSDSMGGSESDWIPHIRVDDHAVGTAPPSPQRVVVYPNPSFGEVTLETHLTSNERVDIAIYSTDGRLLKRLRTAS